MDGNFLGAYLIEKEIASKDDVLSAFIRQIESIPSIHRLLYEKKWIDTEAHLKLLEVQQTQKLDVFSGLTKLGLLTEKLQKNVTSELEKVRVPLLQILIEDGKVSMEEGLKILDDYVYEAQEQKPDEEHISEPLVNIPDDSLQQKVPSQSHFSQLSVGRSVENIQDSAEPQSEAQASGASKPKRLNAILLAKFLSDFTQEKIDSWKSVISGKEDQVSLEEINGIKCALKMMESGSRFLNAVKTESFLNSFSKLFESFMRGREAGVETTDLDREHLNMFFDKLSRLRRSLHQHSSEEPFWDQEVSIPEENSASEISEAIKTEPLEERKNDAPSINKKSILITDDSRSVHTFLKSIFNEEDFDIDSAYSGEEALEKINGEHNYQLVLLDWEMPGLNGFETLQKVREVNKTLPVAMMTSKSHMSNIKNAMNAGANEYIMKPFTSEIMINKVSPLLEKAS